MILNHDKLLSNVAFNCNPRPSTLAVITKAHSGVEPWYGMPPVCGGTGSGAAGKASAAMTQVAGSGLTRAKAGVCTRAYVAAHNPCGGRVAQGGDAVTAQLIGGAVQVDPSLTLLGFNA